MNSLAVTISDTTNEPVISTEPVNSEPCSSEITLNPSTGDTDAVTEPDAILDASSVKAERGILNNPAPSPLITPSTVSEPVISTEPVNCCESAVESPKMFEPLE